MHLEVGQVSKVKTDLRSHSLKRLVSDTGTVSSNKSVCVH